ncbi:HD domain-containing phosphohydrolase [Geobacter sp.]|uniref:HD domain-containing phosphohydrolase n=1 Tax=Geobacter sp. TaxID=46610 RepID=UPI00260CB3F9|nr:HD domain-containing phosphohydrolase [Geobacter sp.]
MKVLFVDDEEYILHSLDRLFRDEEFEVLTAGSGEEGVRILETVSGVGVIVSDQRMPGMAGTDFLFRAREIAPDAIRMLLTGYADITAAIDAINRGSAGRYISKPFENDELLQIIRDGVARYALVVENRRLTDELRQWNESLRERVMAQTAQIRKNNEELHLLNDRLGKNYRGVIQSFAKLLELRDRESRDHAGNVAALAAGAALNLGLPPEEVETVRVAALLHDIGKIGMPDGHLGFDFSSGEGEGAEEYRQHPVRGQTALDSVEDLRGAGLFIRHHHERFDGGGFPDALAGGDIPLGSRIIALVDFADRTMAGGEEGGAEGCLKALEGELGKRFDPELFRHVVKPIRTLYADLKPRNFLVERELPPEDLLTGMVLAQDVVSGTGLLLLNRGVTLDRMKISAILRYYQLDPPRGGVRVFTKG